MKPYLVNIKGRVKNFSLPKKWTLIPLYEAVVNSLHAIEERRINEKFFKDGKIVIEAVRDGQISLLEDEVAPISSFIISDNGIGFNEQNMQSFLESDSTYKSNIGGKGVGRFSWLKVFKNASISSVYNYNETFLKREFLFSLEDKYIDDTLTECNDSNDCLTTIKLNNCLPDYQSDIPKQIDTIAKGIIQHCLVYFLDLNCPQIILKDDLETIVLNQLFREKFKPEDNYEEFLIQERKFSLLNVKIEDKNFNGNKLYLCANNRLVASEDPGKYIVDLDRQIFEKYGFLYVGVLTSEYLDEHVDMNRLSFTLPKREDCLFQEITLDIIMENSCHKVKEYLMEYLKPITEEKIERIKRYTSSVAPQYRHLNEYMPDEFLNIKPNLSDDKLDDTLHSLKRIFEKRSKKEQSALIKKIDDDSLKQEDFEIDLKKQVKKIIDTNASVLAEYVTHRKAIIELLDLGIRKQDDGKFNKENYLHNLIYPMRSTADDIELDAHNLWLIDEKLSYCNFISSDVPFDKDNKQERTDILILDNPVAVSDNKNDGTAFDTIIIFELKKPMRNDYTETNNPITQLTNYAMKILDGKAKDKYGRLINTSPVTKFYLYAVCDITDKIKQHAKMFGYKPTIDGLGYYWYNENINAYYEILSYDKILNDAKKRNRIFFDKLGI